MSYMFNDADNSNVDIAQVAVQVDTLPTAWRDTESISRSRCRRYMLLRAPHHLGLFDVDGARVDALPPHPHRTLTAASLLCTPCPSHAASSLPPDGLVVAAGDDDSVLTITRSTSVSDGLTCASLVVGQGDMWRTLRDRLSINAVVPCDTSARYLVCHREREGSAAVWMCSLENEQAWLVPLPIPEGAADTPVRLFDLAPRQQRGTSSPSKQANFLGCASATCASLHTTSTLAAAAVFPLPQTEGPCGGWVVEHFSAIAPEHRYCVVLRDGRGKRCVGCYDIRKPCEPYCWVREGKAGEPSLDVKTERGKCASVPSDSFLESFGFQDGAACVLTVPSARAAASREAALTTWRVTPNGFCARHRLPFPPHGNEESLSEVRAIAFTENGVLHVLKAA